MAIKRADTVYKSKAKKPKKGDPVKGFLKGINPEKLKKSKKRRRTPGMKLGKII